MLLIQLQRKTRFRCYQPGFGVAASNCRFKRSETSMDSVPKITNPAPCPAITCTGA
ncbi:MAG: hypothetical protein ORN28_01775 [Rhodoferax sp.]|nr:hypothetical protein [Rhodoferax sp.]